MKTPWGCTRVILALWRQRRRIFETLSETHALPKKPEEICGAGGLVGWVKYLLRKREGCAGHRPVGLSYGAHVPRPFCRG